MSGESLETTTAEPTLDELVREEQARLKLAAKSLAAAATAIAPLGRAAAYADLEKLRKALDRARIKIPEGLREEPQLSELMQRLRSWVDDAGERQKRQLGRDLKGACATEDLGFSVVSREEPIEVRIAPFSVVFDFDRGQAELRFARQPIAVCAAEVSAILAERRRQLKVFECAFKPEVFFERCQRAWRAARAASGRDEERVEILDFLPYLAMEMQGPKFKVDPADTHYKGYSRARFAYDVLRLRRQRLLAQDGVRMNFGVATGTTATQKKRVIYFEDEDGNGEFKLTVFFSSEGERAS